KRRAASLPARSSRCTLAMPATRADSSSHSSMRWPMPSRRCDGRTASRTRCARSSPSSMMAKPASASRVAAAAAAPVSPGAGLPPSEATIVSVSRSRIAFSTRGASYFHPSPDSMKSRDISATAWASRGSASRIAIARWVMKRILPRSNVNFDGLQGGQNVNNINQAQDLAALSPEDAASRIAGATGAEIVAVLSHLRPAFVQDVLAALPVESRARALAAAPDEVSRQWQRNALYEQGTVGRMMEPVIGAYPPEESVGDTIESLRELVKMAFITYIYVVDRSERLLGIVTMRDLLFSEHNKSL